MAVHFGGIDLCAVAVCRARTVCVWWTYVQYVVQCGGPVCSVCAGPTVCDVGVVDLCAVCGTYVQCVWWPYVRCVCVVDLLVYSSGQSTDKMSGQQHGLLLHVMDTDKDLYMT